jgi:hypothetical protein
MSNSKASTFAETTRFDAEIVCTHPSRGSRHARRITIDRRHTDTRASNADDVRRK